MRIFLYEFLTGGGWLEEQLPLPESPLPESPLPESPLPESPLPESPLPESLLREGGAMARALAEDFLGIDGIEVSAMRDHRLEEFDLPGCQLTTITSPDQERQEFQRLASQADWTVLIVPEIDAHLARRSHWVTEAGGRPLAPPLETIALLSDKHRTAEHLADHGVPVPLGRILTQGQSLPANFHYPAVVKPIDGAGSLGVLYVEHAQSGFVALERDYRLESFIPGKPASVAALCGPQKTATLPACYQHLSTDGRFAYSGGSLPLERGEAMRAQRLALQAIETLGPVLGYLGVDLILGEASDGSQDCVIEINPRLTTSYVGLRAATDHNLAQAMLALASGREVSLSFLDDPIQFEADGSVHQPVRL